MTNQKRGFALILAFVLCLTMLFSATFIVTEADHDCTGEDCPICYQISICENTLKTLSYAVIAITLTLALIYCLTLSVPMSFLGRKNTSLITLKVKLSN